MDASFTVNINASGYEEAKKEAPKAIDDALYQMGVLAVEGAVRSISGRYTAGNQAVDTGRLRASISFITKDASGASAEPTPPNAEPTDRLSGKGEDGFVIVGTNVSYGEYVHNGTSRMQGRPFLREGIDQKRNEMQKAVERILKGE